MRLTYVVSLCTASLVLAGCFAAGKSDPSGQGGGGGASNPGSGGSTGTGGSSHTGGSGGGGTGGAAGSGGTTGTGGTGGGINDTCTLPTSYRNLFVEILAKTQTDVDTKLNTAVQQLFHGNTSTQAIYFELASDTTQAYIEDINNGDVRSEGMSYGMLIAVSMNMKTEFDKLWKFASTRMLQPSGLFAWDLNTSGGIISSGAAPDGDEYFATALMLASRRWGDNTGTNYGAAALASMNALATKNVFNGSNPTIVKFTTGSNFTDASYVLPLFYSQWACFDTAHATMWSNAATNARTFFHNAVNATTGLAPDHSNFDGTPQSGSNFGADAWRVTMNIMMDFNINNADPWQGQTYAPLMAGFWTGIGLNRYGNGYTLAGTQTAAGHGAGLVGVNAMLAFALQPTAGKPFVQAAWDEAIPTGQFRYYDGALYLLSMLHMSGKFTLGN
jgi:oligosaccharide reducing-end xylanase